MNDPRPLDTPDEQPASPTMISRRTFAIGALTGIAALALPHEWLRTAATAHAAPLASDALGPWDVTPSCWPAHDGLGRDLPLHDEVGSPRPNRFVGLFYFTWLGQHTTTGPWDITKILEQHPDAINDKNHPAWGPMKHFHHWGEPQFGYYRSDDAWVIRKHATMLSDAGVDAIFIDTTNQHLYAKPYHTILDTFAEVRADGSPTPGLAFLTPFADPRQVVINLYYDLYRPGTHSDLFFEWEGKPLILADPTPFNGTAVIAGGADASILPNGHTQGQTFTATGTFASVSCPVPTGMTTNSGVTLALRRNGPSGPLIVQQAFANIVDNALVALHLPTNQPPGVYYLEQSSPIGTIGWWSYPNNVYGGGNSYYDSVAFDGDRNITIEYTTIDRVAVIDIEASRQAVNLDSGTLGQTFHIGYSFNAIGAQVGTWYTTDSDVTVTLRESSPTGAVVKQQRFNDIADNSYVMMDVDNASPAGDYYLELSNGNGPIAWWSAAVDCYLYGEAYQNGQPVAGDRSVFARPAEGTMQDIRDFFTFRKPEPSYIVGPSGPNQWGWLEDYPQHVFRDDQNHAEQVAVGVAQNLVDGRLGAMSEPHAQGRSFHDETLPAGTEQTALGLNMQEQWERALQLDPEFIFITGWNEWVAQRFDPETKPIPDAQGEVIFYDQFDWEHSRDIEPMVGGHTDSYYYQMVANIRRFKGADPTPVASGPTTIALDGSFTDWAGVQPEFRDHAGDTAHRRSSGWGDAGVYTNDSGRNDIVAAKVARDATTVYFYVKTAAPMTAHTDPNWMMLFLDTDGDVAHGWEGFDFVLNRTVKSSSQTVLERSTGGWNWTPVGTVSYRQTSNEMEIAVPRNLLGLAQDPITLDFKWIDNMQHDGDILDTISNGDAAPSGRFRYRYRTV